MVKIILSGEMHIGAKYELQHKNLLDESDCLFLEGVKSDSDNRRRDILYPIFLITLRAYFNVSNLIYHPKKTLLDYAKERGIPVYPKEDLTLSQIYDLAGPILKVSLIISIFLGCLTFYLPLFFLLKFIGFGISLTGYNLIFIFIACIVISIIYSMSIGLIVSKPREKLFAEKVNEIIKGKKVQ